jgi:hypothetical protein
MQKFLRVGPAAVLCAAALLLAACAGQKQPAQKLIGDVEATVIAASAEAAKYVPDQLAEVQAKLGLLKASFDRQDYAAVMSAGPAVLGEAQDLATAAAAKQDAVLKALNEEWNELAGSVPGDVSALQNRIDMLGRKSSKALAAGIDLPAAKAALSDATLLWSKAQGAFASGNLGEAVGTAKDVKVKLEAVAGAVKLQLPAPQESA